MARLFNGTSELLSTTSIPDGSLPMTFGAWVYMTDVSSVQTVFCLADASSNNVFERLQLSGSTLRLRSNDGGSARNVISSGTMSAGTWQHCVAVVAGAATRTVYIDGANAVTGTNSFSPALARMALGATIRSSASQHFLAGRIADAFFYDVALSDDEVAALAAGASPRLVRPGNLLGYWPLWGIASPETDYMGNTSMALTGSPSAADGPPMASNFAASASMPQSVEDITLGPYSVAASSSYQAGSPTSERWQGGGVMNDEYQAGGVTSGSV